MKIFFTLIGTFVGLFQATYYLTISRFYKNTIFFRKGTFGSIIMYSKILVEINIEKICFIVNSTDRIPKNIKFLNSNILIQQFGLILKINNYNLIFPCSRKLQNLYITKLLPILINNSKIFDPISFNLKYIFNNKFNIGLTNENILENIVYFFIKLCYKNNNNNNKSNYIVIYWRSKYWAKNELERNYNQHLLKEIINLTKEKFEIVLVGDIDNIDSTINVKKINPNQLCKKEYINYLNLVKNSKLMIGTDGGGIWLGYYFSIPVFLLSNKLSIEKNNIIGAKIENDSFDTNLLKRFINEYI